LRPFRPSCRTRPAAPCAGVRPMRWYTTAHSAHWRNCRPRPWSWGGCSGY